MIELEDFMHGSAWYMYPSVQLEVEGTDGNKTTSSTYNTMPSYLTHVTQATMY